jgi:hypothetical protein
MSARIEKLLSGKAGELKVFVKLLEHELIPYVPLVDEGIDCILKNGKKIQIKTVRTKRDPLWFQVSNIEPQDDFFIVGIDANDQFWIFPSKIFAENATCSKEISDLNLEKKGLYEKLKNHRDAWLLLAE